MCNSCFNNEYEKFPSQENFNKFEIELDKKLQKKNLEPIIEKNHKNNLDFSYKCIKCNTIWHLSTPDNAWRGYFLTKENANKYLEKLRKKQQKGSIGCWLILLLIVSTILIFVLK